MSTKITAVYNALVTDIETLFPGRFRLPNPYKPEENASGMWETGYGITFDSGSDTSLEICKISMDRNFTIILTQKAYALENDAVARAAADLALLEDQFLLIKTLKPETFCYNAADFVMVNDGGIEYVTANRDSFLMIRSSFNLKYFENY